MTCKYKNNITKLNSYKFKNNYTIICICIHVSIPGLLYKYHWRHANEMYFYDRYNEFEYNHDF